MHLYLEFDAIVRRFAEEKIRYAVAGALAVAMHGFLRTTEDMDFLVHPGDLGSASDILAGLGYMRPKETWTFSNTKISLWRFLKPVREPEETIMVDVMVPESDEGRAMVEHAVEVPYADVRVRVVTKDDLVKMKMARGSTQDAADIERMQEGGREEV